MIFHLTETSTFLDEVRIEGEKNRQHYHPFKEIEKLIVKKIFTLIIKTF